MGDRDGLAHDLDRVIDRSARAFSVPIASERRSSSLFCRVFSTQTGIHFAGKCSRALTHSLGSYARALALRYESIFPNSGWCLGLDRCTSVRIVAEQMSSGSFLGVSALIFAAKRGCHDHRLRVHVGDGRDTDAGRLTYPWLRFQCADQDVAPRRGVVHRHVDRNDGGDDAAIPGPDAMALPSDRRQVGQAAPESADSGGGRGYVFVWTAIGMVVFPLGCALAAILTEEPELARVVPIAAGLVVFIAGGFQFTAWKAHRLACCREATVCGRALPADVRTAWRHGLRLGLRCALAAPARWRSSSLSASWTCARWLS